MVYIPLVSMFTSMKTFLFLCIASVATAFHIGAGRVLQAGSIAMKAEAEGIIKEAIYECLEELSEDATKRSDSKDI